ncbi:esterase [Hydrogenophaga sp. RWCD_12]|uniref:esterase n=1 Tax=Hydrogenophaga sp. RWCD_12 TaxID=3391190 RepID=UPI0039849CED
MDSRHEAPAGDIVLHRPTAPAHQLVLLFHGVGASPEGFQALGPALARDDRWVVAVRSPFASDFGAGWQWFSVQGVTETNRAGRIAEVMPRFAETVRRWQARTGLMAAQTVLAGFSQGAIMSLESTQVGEPLAARVVAMSGRFAVPPRQAPEGVVWRFVHGDQDPVIGAAHSTQAVAQLRALGADAYADVLPGLGHGIDQRALALLVAAVDAGAKA